ncbi:unnamed protein product [Ascophyllum nodosum]
MSDFAQLAAKVKEDDVAAAAAAAAGASAEPAASGSTAAAEAPAAQAGEEGADRDAVTATAPEEESTAQFEPVVQLEEVEVKTHEEDEEVVWKMRAKLFIFGETLLNKGTGQNEWVERGIGEVKFLQHTASKYIRLLMRQEKTMKVICNHVADPRIVLKPNAGSDRSWVWNAFDFAEGELEETTFALRFGNSDTAQEFEKQFMAAQDIVKGIMEGTAPAGEESAPAAEEQAPEQADAGTDEAADALQNLNVGGEDA